MRLDVQIGIMRINMNEKFKRKSLNHTMIPKKVLWDNELSLGAKGLYAYLLGFSHHGKCLPIYTTQFRKHLGIGHKEIIKYLLELYSHNFIEFKIYNKGIKKYSELLSQRYYVAFEDLGPTYEYMEYIVTLI